MARFSLRKMPYFHLISRRGNFMERHSFRIVSGESPSRYPVKILSQNISQNSQENTCDGFMLPRLAFLLKKTQSQVGFFATFMKISGIAFV